MTRSFRLPLVLALSSAFIALPSLADTVIIAPSPLLGYLQQQQQINSGGSSFSPYGSNAQQSAGGNGFSAFRGAIIPVPQTPPATSEPTLNVTNQQFMGKLSPAPGSPDSASSKAPGATKEPTSKDAKDEKKGKAPVTPNVSPQGTMSVIDLCTQEINVTYDTSKVNWDKSTVNAWTTLPSGQRVMSSVKGGVMQNPEGFMIPAFSTDAQGHGLAVRAVPVEVTLRGVDGQVYAQQTLPLGACGVETPAR